MVHVEVRIVLLDVQSGHFLSTSINLGKCFNHFILRRRKFTSKQRKIERNVRFERVNMIIRSTSDEAHEAGFGLTIRGARLLPLPLGKI